MKSEMSYLVQSPSKEDQRAVIQFLTEGCKPVYGDQAVSKTTVTDCSKKFREGRTETSDLPRPGQANKIVSESLAESIDAAVRAIVDEAFEIWQMSSMFPLTQCIPL